MGEEKIELLLFPSNNDGFQNRINGSITKFEMDKKKGTIDVYINKRYYKDMTENYPKYLEYQENGSFELYKVLPIDCRHEFKKDYFITVFKLMEKIDLEKIKGLSDISNAIQKRLCIENVNIEFNIISSGGLITNLDRKNNKMELTLYRTKIDKIVGDSLINWTSQMESFCGMEFENISLDPLYKHAKLSKFDTCTKSILGVENVNIKLLSWKVIPEDFYNKYIIEFEFYGQNS